MLRCYYMDISCDCSYEQSQALYRLLPEERQVGIKQLKNEEMIKKRILSGVFLQYGLSHLLDIPMRQIVYRYGEFGKPMLDKKLVEDCKFGKTIDFNLSHSGRYVVLAVSDSRVGIDIEERKKDRLAVAKRCFDKREYEDIVMADTEVERDMRFLEYWTMKEAYVKYLGEGIHVPFHSFFIRRKEDDLSYVEKSWQKQGGYFATSFLEELYCLSVCSSNRRDLEAIQGHTGTFLKIFQRISLEDLMFAGV